MLLWKTPQRVRYVSLVRHAVSKNGISLNSNFSRIQRDDSGTFEYECNRPFFYPFQAWWYPQTTLTERWANFILYSFGTAYQRTWSVPVELKFVKLPH